MAEPIRGRFHKELIGDEIGGLQSRNSTIRSRSVLGGQFQLPSPPPPLYRGAPVVCVSSDLPQP
jgi:hypothetical protein